MHWLTRLFRKQKSEQQLDAELRFHLEQQIAGNLAACYIPARRAASIDPVIGMSDMPMRIGASVMVLVLSLAGLGWPRPFFRKDKGGQESAFHSSWTQPERQ